MPDVTSLTSTGPVSVLFDFFFFLIGRTDPEEHFHDFVMLKYIFDFLSHHCKEIDIHHFLFVSSPSHKYNSECVPNYLSEIF